jgi:AcrR family transcriptional regulator
LSYEKIKISALKLFSKKGFDGTTVKDIANESDLKPSSIYSHFASKEEIFMVIWNECIENSLKSVECIKKRIQNNEEQVLDEQILYEYYFRIIEHFIKNKEEYLFLKQATFFTRNQNISDKMNIVELFSAEVYMEYFSEIINQLKLKNLIKDDDCKDFFFSYIGLIIAYLEEVLIYDINLNKEHISKFWNIFWKGVQI